MPNLASIVTAILLICVATGLLLTVNLFAINNSEGIENWPGQSANGNSENLPHQKTYESDTLIQKPSGGFQRGNKTRAAIQKICGEKGRVDRRNGTNLPAFEYKNTTPSDSENRYLNKYDGNSPDWVLEKGNFSPENPTSSMYEVTRFPYRDPTKKEVEKAWELYNKSYEAAEQREWFDFDNALEDGYQRFDVVHYINKCYYVNHENLNPFRPESLIYYPNPSDEEEMILAGYMYLTDGLQTEGRQVGGPLTVWHYHPTRYERCFVSMLSRGREFSDIGCSRDAVTRARSPEMLHVWFIEHPEGPFGSRMGIPESYIQIQNNSSIPRKLTESEFKSLVENS